MEKYFKSDFRKKNLSQCELHTRIFDAEYILCIRWEIRTSHIRIHTYLNRSPKVDFCGVAPRPACRASTLWGSAVVVAMTRNLWYASRALNPPPQCSSSRRAVVAFRNSINCSNQGYRATRYDFFSVQFTIKEMFMCSDLDSCLWLYYWY